MTEKRFSYEEVNFCNDNITGNQFDLTNPNEMLDLLNSLADENKQLKKQLSNVQTLYKSTDDNLFACRETNNELRECYSKLEKENEQLKQTIETQNFNYDNAKSIIHDSENQIRNLKDKNQQYEILVKSLKEQNQKLKLRLKDLGVEYL